MLPAPLIAGRRGASGRNSTPHAGDKGKLDLFSDADRENFETRDYTTTTFTFSFGGKGKRAEGNNTSSRDTLSSQAYQQKAQSLPQTIQFTHLESSLARREGRKWLDEVVVAVDSIQVN